MSLIRTHGILGVGLPIILHGTIIQHFTKNGDDMYGATVSKPVKFNVTIVVPLTKTEAASIYKRTNR